MRKKVRKLGRGDTRGSEKSKVKIVKKMRDDRLLPRTSVVTIIQPAVKVLPTCGGIQLKQRGSSNTVASNGAINALLDSVHDRAGLCLCLLAFACKLNIVECDEATADTSCSVEFIKSIVELTEPKLSLAGDNTPRAQRIPFGRIKVGGEPQLD